MTLKTHRAKPAVDFFELVELIRAKYRYDLNDMGGKYSAETLAADKAFEAEWMEQNGYAGKEHVLNYPNGMLPDWPKDSPEMALRIEINLKRKATGYYENCPSGKIEYQDVWDWLLDHDFCELRNGSYQYLGLDKEALEDESNVAPDYVIKFLKAVLAEVEGHEAFDGENLYVWIEW